MKTFFLLTLCLTSVFASIHPDWRHVGSSPNKLHSVTFAVAQRNNFAADCHSLLMDVSHPDSASYGQHFTLEEIKKFSVREESVLAVKDWLNQRNIPYRTNLNEDLITANAPISVWNNLLRADYQNFRSVTGDKTISRTNSYTIPAELKDHIDFIGHTTRIPGANSRFGFPSRVDKRQQNIVVPSLLTSYYDITRTSVTNQANIQGLFEAGQSFSPADLAQFQQTFNLNSQAATVAYGPNYPQNCSTNLDSCGEATLDVEYIMAVAPNAPTNFYFMNPESADPFLDYIDLMSSTQTPPLVHSFSYGSIATEDDQLDMTRFNTEVCKMGLRGLTVVVAAGDDGVANYIARNNASACGFQPSYPATSPYVLAVGATQGPESQQPEKACMSNTGGIVTTGGGFSYFFPRPSYQDTAVKTYLQTAPNLPPRGMYNPNGRGYPDIAALGFNYAIVLAGQTLAVSGTSASCPVIAGMLTLINDARSAAGKSSIGFVNPALYDLHSKNPNLFHDITQGENNCCAGQIGSIVCCPYGFNATAGWDPLSGLGSPKWSDLNAALLKL